MKKIVKILGIIGVLLLLLGAGAGTYIYFDVKKFIDTPANQTLNTEARSFYMIVDKGNTFAQIAGKLHEEGAISDVMRFKLYGRWKGLTGKIKAGQFEFRSDWTPKQVLEQLVYGRPLLHRITIPEGLPWWEVAKLLEENGFVKAADFEACVKDAALVKRYGIPFATAEGFLFPETYMLNKVATPTKADAEQIMVTMIQTFWSRTAGIWEAAAEVANIPPNASVEVTASGQVIASFVPRYARKYPDEVRRIIILSSLVEKESAVADERPRVAGVYTNRLRIRMPLQCDPTIIYGIGPSFKGSILRSQINDEKNPYNTYKFYGLPPGPICSAGFESIQAAYKPEINSYLYFVATGTDGRHTFSRTLAEHNQAVQKYRQALNARNNGK